MSKKTKQASSKTMNNISKIMAITMAVSPMVAVSPSGVSAQADLEVIPTVTDTPTVTGTVYAGDTQIVGAAAAFDTIAVSRGGTQIGSVLADENGIYIAVLSAWPLREGEVLTVTALGAGKTISTPLSITVATSPSGWVHYGNDPNWSINNGTYYANIPNEFKLAATNNMNLSNFSLEGDLNVTGPGNAGFLLRMNTPEDGVDQVNGYYVGISKGANDSVFIGKHSHSWYQFPGTQNISSKSIHHLKIIANGANIKVYVDYANSPQINLNDNTYSNGMIGLRAIATAATWSNLVVTNLISAEIPANNLPTFPFGMIAGHSFQQGDTFATFKPSFAGQNTLEIQWPSDGINNQTALAGNLSASDFQIVSYDINGSNPQPVAIQQITNGLTVDGLKQTNFIMTDNFAADKTYSLKLKTSNVITLLQSTNNGRIYLATSFGGEVEFRLFTGIHFGVLPLNSPLGISFEDMDLSERIIRGKITINRASDESDINAYVVYWGNAQGPLAGTYPLVTINKSVGEITYAMADSIPIPNGATRLLAYSLNDFGVNASYVSTEINDLVLTPPTLVRDTSNPYEESANEITFSSNQNWADHIDAVYDGLNLLVKDVNYIVSPSKITFNPNTFSAIGANPTHQIRIVAAGYSDAIVSQNVYHALNAMNITQSGVVAKNSGGIVATATITRNQGNSGDELVVFELADGSVVKQAQVFTNTNEAGGTFTANFTDLSVTNAAYQVNVYVVNSYDIKTHIKGFDLAPHVTLTGITFANLLDADHDNKIAIDDLIIFINSAGLKDFNQDGVINREDIALLLNFITPISGNN
jgi:hypothetical protein